MTYNDEKLREDKARSERIYKELCGNSRYPCKNCLAVEDPQTCNIMCYGWKLWFKDTLDGHIDQLIQLKQGGK